MASLRASWRRLWEVAVDAQFSAAQVKLWLAAIAAAALTTLLEGVFSLSASDVGADWALFAARLEAVVPEPQRTSIVRELALWFGLPSALVIVLSTFAVPSFSTYANAGILLRYGRYRLRWQRVPIARVFMGRTDLLSATLLLAIASSAASAAAGLLALIGVRLFVGTLILLAFAGGAQLVVVLQLIYWVLRLRLPGELAWELADRGINILSHVESRVANRLPFGQRQTGPERRALRLPYSEQEELTRVIETLSQVALLAQADRLPLAVEDALLGLNAIHRDHSERQRRRALPESWFDLAIDQSARPTSAQPRENWVDRLIAESLVAILLAGIGERDQIGTRTASSLLLAVGVSTLESPSPEGVAPVLSRVLAGYRLALLSAVARAELILRDEIFEQAEALLARLAQTAAAPSGVAKTSTQAAWQDVYNDELSRMGLDLGVPWTLGEETIAVNQLLRSLQTVGASRREALVRIALQLAAAALASQRFRALGPVLAWLSALDEEGSVLIAQTSDLLERAVMQRVPFGPESLRVVVALLAAYDYEPGGGTWTAPNRIAACVTLGVLDRLDARCQSATDRLALAGFALNRSSNPWGARLTQLRDWYQGQN